MSVINKVSLTLLLCFIVAQETRSLNVPDQNVEYDRSKRQIGQECILPPNPAFGSWSFINKPLNYASGLQVPANTILEIRCNKGQNLDGSSITACVKGSWMPPMGNCKKSCPPLYSTSTMEITCTYKNEVINCTEPMKGTLAQFKCKSYYEDTRYTKPKVMCLDGEWSGITPECSPVCGRANLKKRITLIVNATVAKKGEFPWQIALYTTRDKELICGGTILSERIVLTAAHCVTDEYGKLHPKENYFLVAGKYYRKFDHPEDLDCRQVSKISGMFLPEQFEGYEQNYMGDVALLVTKETLNFTDRIRPICIDWDRKYANVVLNSGQEKGYVSGWGYTKQNAEPSDVLRSISVPSIQRKECKNILPHEYRIFLTYDKFCAGYLDKGTSVCSGDSGGGLVFKKEGTYFIAGVVSLGPLADSSEGGGCDSQMYSLYTCVYNYTDDFILRKLSEYTLSKHRSATEKPDLVLPTPVGPTQSGSCILPNYPDFGTWNVLPNTTKPHSPGMYVPSGTILHFKCQHKHRYDGTRLSCSGGNWTGTMGKCSEPCPSLYNSPQMKVTCIFKGQVMENCVAPVDGTTAKFECSEFYELSVSNQMPSLCLNGNWTRISQCVPICGEVTSVENSKGRYPWNVAVYANINNTRKLECEGSLISTKLVITAAHCASKYFYEKYSVVAGKYHKEYDHPEDENAQYSEVDMVLTPPSIEGLDTFENDIAMMVLKTPFVLTSLVQPVCIDWGSNINQATIKEAYVNGWDTKPNLKPSEIFSEQKYKMLTEKFCSNEVEDDKNDDYMFDKTCARFDGNSSLPCKTEPGGGLVFKQDKYYLVGVFSAGVGTCSTQYNAFFTSIASHLDTFILVETVRSKN